MTSLRAVGRVVASPQGVAAVLMIAGITVGTIGALSQWGVPIGLMVLAGLLIGLSILIGWE